ncbi:MAG TPA: hypothetical protein VK157_14415 [Phycisphaerales bacterium]|nr:hypothetical protein [Phycisphaerales bacterium]
MNDSGVVHALHVTTTGDVLAGGSFDRAGSAIARNFSILDAPAVCACDSVDFNRNGVFPEDQDIVDFFFVFGGGVCSACADIDFNNNNVLPETQDVIDFLHVFAGGNCP